MLKCAIAARVKYDVLLHISPYWCFNSRHVCWVAEYSLAEASTDCSTFTIFYSLPGSAFCSMQKCAGICNNACGTDVVVRAAITSWDLLFARFLHLRMYVYTYMNQCTNIDKCTVLMRWCGFCTKCFLSHIRRNELKYTFRRVEKLICQPHTFHAEQTNERMMSLAQE